ncbi:hypothetical protein JXA40_09645 [bacterium]|nr:hypothetical protein [candidate division CSSED10-310 bacterium]
MNGKNFLAGLIGSILLIVPNMSAAEITRVTVEEMTSGTGSSDGTEFCRFQYKLSMDFEVKKPGTGDMFSALMRPVPEEAKKAAGGKLPEILFQLKPVESSMKVLEWKINDPENSNPPLARFPKGPGGMGVDTNYTLGWKAGSDIYLGYGFVGDGIYSYFADWDTDEEISRTQPQPAGCRPWYGGDQNFYVIGQSKWNEGKMFILEREFDSTDDEIWKSHTKLTITFLP